MTSATGTCSVRYDQAGSATYNAAPQVVESVTAAAAAPTRFTLTVSKSGTGSGTVTSSVGAVNCGTTCTADFDAGTSVTLAATSGSALTLSAADDEVDFRALAKPRAGLRVLRDDLEPFATVRDLACATFPVRQCAAAIFRGALASGLPFTFGTMHLRTASGSAEPLKVAVTVFGRVERQA